MNESALNMKIKTQKTTETEQTPSSGRKTGDETEMSTTESEDDKGE